MIKKIFLVLFCLSSTNTFALYNFRTPTGIFLSYRAMNSHKGNMKINDNTQTDVKNNKEATAGKAEVHDGDIFKINDKKSNRRGELCSPVLPTIKFHTKK